MDHAMAGINAWFFRCEDLSDAINAFGRSHAADFVVDPIGDHFASNGVRGWDAFKTNDNTIENQHTTATAALHRKAVHSLFEVVFENLLCAHLKSTGISSEQFQSVFQLSILEEKRGGTFYRFLGCTEYVPFVAAMELVYEGANLMTALRSGVREAESIAKQTWVRTKMIIPLLDLWGAESFGEINQFLQRQEVVIERKQQKALAQWRCRLLARSADKHGVYQSPIADQEEWSRYVLAFADSLPDATEFAKFAEILKIHAQSIQATSITGFCKRISHVLFQELDVHAERVVPYNVVCKTFKEVCAGGGGGGGASKAEKKILAKHAVGLTSICLVQKQTLVIGAGQFEVLLRDLAGVRAGVVCKGGDAAVEEEHLKALCYLESKAVPGLLEGEEEEEGGGGDVRAHDMLQLCAAMLRCARSCVTER